VWHTDLKVCRCIKVVRLFVCLGNIDNQDMLLHSLTIAPLLSQLISIKIKRWRANTIWLISIVNSQIISRKSNIPTISKNQNDAVAYVGLINKIERWFCETLWVWLRVQGFNDKRNYTILNTAKMRVYTDCLGTQSHSLSRWFIIPSRQTQATCLN